MRERRRRETAARLGSASWIDAKGRVEHTGLWIDPKGSRPRFAGHAAQRWILLLSAVAMLIPMYGEAQRRGWIPDFEAIQPFPETGSVTVAGNVVGFVSKSSLTIAASAASAVVQLYDPDTNQHALSIYVGANERIEVPVPSGTYRVRLIEGQKWHGPKRFFGPNTSYETVADLMKFDPGAGHIIDLHRRPDGNLKTRLMVTGPRPL
ncbi:hypothetical protein [Sphingobium chlorophenolicum]|uniref:Uncharacterized protein n=1 Tax=Sphingobium chlorophenolicum TaxID=46429 RepID=A0A081REW4_SPHCR|nr:hypothetical protein [Sphingobium chlorophenolicum]KEQ53737.1 hypothetical protein BV95_01953 [Sphingobium chlorophenolicum]